MFKFIKSVVFYAIAVPFSLAWLYLGVMGLIEGWQSLSWPCVSGTVQRVGVSKYAPPQRQTLSSRYQFSLEYSFIANGTEHTGGRITTDDLLYGEIFTVGFRGIQRLTAQFAPGNEVKVCYDPAAPDNASLLQPGISLGSVVRFVGGLIVALVVILPRVSPRFRRSE